MYSMGNKNPEKNNIVAEYHRISQNITEYHRISQNITEYHRISQNITEYHSRQQLDGNTSQLGPEVCKYGMCVTCALSINVL